MSKATATNATDSAVPGSIPMPMPPSDSDFPVALSPEYFRALSENSNSHLEHEHGHERLVSLLLLPAFILTDGNINVSNHREHADDSDTMANAPGTLMDMLLHRSCMFISPSNVHVDPSVHPSLAFQYLSTIAQSNLLLHFSNDMNAMVKVLAQVRNAAAVLAHYPDTIHSISKSGILHKLLSLQHGHGESVSATAKSHFHVEFLQCCILAKQYRFAKRHFMPFAMPNADNTSVMAIANSNASANVSVPSDEIYLLYHYLRGIVYYESSLPDLHLAIQEWSHCIATPAHEMSAIVIAAWKKMTLAKCLLCQYDDEQQLVEHHSRIQNKGHGQVRGQGHGRAGGMQMPSPNSGGKKYTHLEDLKGFLLDLPLATSHVVQRYFKKDVPEIQSYKILVDQFVKNDLHWVDNSNNDGDANIADHTEGTPGHPSSSSQDIFRADGNVDMIKKLIPAMKWRKLRALSKVYNNIPLSRLGYQLGFDRDILHECKEFLMEVDMIQRANRSRGGNGSASNNVVSIEMSIDDEAGIVYFDSEDVNDPMGDNLINKIEQCMALAKRVKELDVDLASSHKYRAIMAKNANANAQKKKDGGSGIGDRDGKSLSVIDMS